jgi:hypothetical protein
VKQVTAFYDDSGEFGPGGRKFACFGMDVVPAQYIRECGDAWWEVIEGHFQFSGSMQMNGIEVKSADIHEMLKRLERKKPLHDIQEKMFTHGLNTETKVSKLIEAIWGFLGKPPVPIKYLAVIANKVEVWQKWRPTQFNQWKTFEQLGEKHKAANLLHELEAFLIRHTYEYLLQRLEYLGKDPDFNFTDSFIVGDQSSSTKVMLETQAGVQAGFGKYSQLPTIVNRPWFGSSLYEPCLQIADWVAFAVRTWAERKGALSYRLEKLLPNFRGYPDQDKVIGRGIVLCPNKECFPNLLPKLKEPSHINASPNSKRLVF